MQFSLLFKIISFIDVISIYLFREQASNLRSSMVYSGFFRPPNLYGICFDLRTLTSYTMPVQLLENIKKKIHSLPLLSKALLYIAAFLAVVLIWTINFYYTWPEMEFSLMYLIPVGWITWRTGRTGGAILAISSTMVWASMDALQNPFFGYSILTYLNVATRAALFLSFVFILARLRDALHRETELSRTDRLTGVANRRAFLEDLDREIRRTQRDIHPMTVVYFDVDDFKTINDTFGHHKGDECLRLVAETINGHMRSTDTIARMGGDEFAILLPEQGYDDSGIVIAMIREKVEEINRKNSMKVTLSIGAVTYLCPPDTTDEIIKFADSLMYIVKQSGKNGIKHETVS